ncbi:proline-rich receptor-like protein kinase PERK10 isoform X4 [Drosophila mauritiana]|uniref:Proline-rich receptor-like protein kinase PERK10 isoform X4 n=1 Tax=Drosophila mauritiana TaxID=7226 RepID=A0A6P8JHE7_DROMA|nr:proline-rich receptor-like protein kinase PERK10 isoform X4 [Drosophila mauritiana]
MQFDPKPRCGGSVVSFTVMLLLITGADFAAGRPDVRESPFALNLQPPLLQSDVTFSSGQGGGAGPKAIDSYGNPIDALRPIDTPDGRKVVSAQGVQFEIPTYASGITEIRRPADDLLPPHIDNTPEDSSSSGSSSTTTFVNTTPIPLDAGNPFDSATIPAWLRDFDYPDVGPGVPFDPDNFGTASASSTRNPTNPPRPPTVPPVSSAFPSKVTLPLPGSSISSSSSSSEEPQLVLVPPADRSEAASGSDSHFGPNPGQLTHPTSNSVTPFAARFEPSASSSSSQSVEPFPPSKVEYTKSDEGKVISTPVTNNQRKTETVAPPASNTGKYTGGFGAPPGLLRPQSTNPSGSNSNPRPGSDIYVAGNQHEFSSVLKANKARPTVNPGRYNGGFGAPTGVLSPQSQAEPRPFQPINQRTEHREQSSGGNRRTESRFGGPPGILVPFDNVQRTGGQ